MAKYIKKPVEIQAEPYREGIEDGIDMVSTYWIELRPIIEAWYGKDVASDNTAAVQIPYINTLEGKHYIRPTDMVITGVKGERYPCKLDIFEMTYESVEEEE